MELASEAEKLAKRLHPRDEEAAELHVVDTFLGALDKNLAGSLDNGRSSCCSPTDREDPGGTSGLQNGAPIQHNA